MLTDSEKAYVRQMICEGVFAQDVPNQQGGTSRIVSPAVLAAVAVKTDEEIRAHIAEWQATKVKAVADRKAALVKEIERINVYLERAGYVEPVVVEPPPVEEGA